MQFGQLAQLSLTKKVSIVATFVVLVGTIITVNTLTRQQHTNSSASSTTSSVTPDATSSKSTGSAVRTLSWSHTTGSHLNSLLLVNVVMTKTNVSQITYGSQQLTYLANIFCPGNCHEAVWYLANPASGTHTITLTLQDADAVSAGASTFYNVNVQSPFGQIASNKGTGAQASVSVSSSLSQLIVDAYGSSQSVGATPVSGQTKLYMTSATTAAGNSYKNGGTGSTTMSWANGNSNQPWTDIALAINGIALAATDTPVPTTTPVPTQIPTQLPTPTPLPTAVPTTAPTTTTISTPISVMPTTTPMPTTAASPTLIPTATPTPVPGSTLLSLTVLLDGIGTAGDRANPGGQGNMQPLHPDRTVSVQVLDTKNNQVASAEGTVVFNSTSGNFTGTVDLGTGFQTGDYLVKVKTDQYLTALVPGIQAITAGQTVQLPQTSLIAGDINNDNVINILDYNILMGCYSDLLPATDCTGTNAVLADLNDDGHVNELDYNLFIRELTTRGGE